MAITGANHVVSEPVEIDVPDEREYDRAADAELDRSLVRAITAAADAGNDFLTQQLRYQLGSHYYGTR